MFTKFKMIRLVLALVATSILTGVRPVSAENTLNGQHSANVQLVLDDTENHEVEVYNGITYFYIDGSNVPLVTTYNNTFPSISFEIVGGANGNRVVFNDHSSAYLAGVDVTFEFMGGDGYDSVEHGINRFSQYFNVHDVTDFPCVLYGQGGMDSLDGGNGDDLIFGQDGVGFLSGGEGDDLLVGGNAMDSIHGDEGNDTIFGGHGWNFLYGDEGNDLITGGHSLDNINGGAGDDTIKGSLGNDNLNGGDNNDLIFGGPGNDDIDGGDGDDVIKGESGMDEIYGGPGDDVMDGAGTQNLAWGFGLWYPTHHDNSNDIIEGGPGADWFKNYMHLKPVGQFATIADEDTRVDYDPGEGDIATQAIWQMTTLPVVYFAW